MFGDIGKMMKLASEMKRRMPELQEKLATTEYTSAAGGGAVSATVNGKMQLTNIKIDKSLLEGGNCDTAMLEDLVKAAVSSAQDKAATAAKAAMKELTGGMDIPGMDGMM